jgi:hypothetical protein
MKKTAMFRRLWGKRDQNPARPTGQAPAQPQAAREMTVQELEQVQGGRAPVRLQIDQTDE